MKKRTNRCVPNSLKRKCNTFDASIFNMFVCALTKCQFYRTYRKSVVIPKIQYLNIQQCIEKLIYAITDANNTSMLSINFPNYSWNRLKCDIPQAKQCATNTDKHTHTHAHVTKSTTRRSNLNSVCLVSDWSIATQSQHVTRLLIDWLVGFLLHLSRDICARV